MYGDTHPQGEVHIAGLVLYPLPDYTDVLRHSITARPSVTLEQGQAEKWVLVLEAYDLPSLSAEVELIGLLPGVLSCVLVYHEVLSTAEAEQFLTEK